MNNPKREKDGKVDFEPVGGWASKEKLPRVRSHDEGADPFTSWPHFSSAPETNRRPR